MRVGGWGGVGWGEFFFWCFESRVYSAGLLRQPELQHQYQPTSPNPSETAKWFIGLFFYWEGERENERNLSKNNTVIEPCCSVARHKGNALGGIRGGLSFMANQSKEVCCLTGFPAALTKHVFYFRHLGSVVMPSLNHIKGFNCRS